MHTGNVRGSAVGTPTPLSKSASPPVLFDWEGKCCGEINVRTTTSTAGVLMKNAEPTLPLRVCATPIRGRTRQGTAGQGRTRRFLLPEQ